MTAATSRRKAPWVIVGLLVVAVAVIAVVVLTRDDSGTQQDANTELTTTAVTRADLAEYLEISGTLDYAEEVTLDARSSGVLTYLAPEGAVVSQGEQLYTIVNEPTAAENANVLAQLESAQRDLMNARDDLEEANDDPSQADVASATSAVSDAEEALAELLEPPSDAEIDTAEAAVLDALETLNDLQNPTEAALAAARSQLANAEQAQADLLEDPTRAQIDTAQASVASAKQALEDLLAGASVADLDAARAAVSSAEENLQTVLDGPSQAEIAKARADVMQAEEDLDPYSYDADAAAADADWRLALQALDDLLAKPTEAEIATAEAEVARAREDLDDLLGGASAADVESAEAARNDAEEALADLLEAPSQAEIDDAQAAVLEAAEALENLENPTEAALATARTQLATAREDLTDLREGPTQAQIESAEAAVLVAQDALEDLLADTELDEMALLEQTVVSAEAALESAEADAAMLADATGARVVMYGETPVYRTMTLGDEGQDVLQLEANLTDLGFADSEGFEADGVFDEATETAVRAWQQQTGRHLDGTVGDEDVLFVAGPVQVGEWATGVELGQELAQGAALATLVVIEAPMGGVMATTQQVVAALPLSDRDLVSEGSEVNVELPDGADVAATVISISPSPVLDTQSGENTVDLTILLSAPVSDVWIGATTDVEIVETLVADALVVPATALLALVEGGYAVEVSDGAGTRLVGVETGLFVDGDVEVQGGSLSVGDQVVIPR